MKHFFLIASFICSHAFSQNSTLETTGDVLLIALPITAATTSIIIGDKKGSFQFIKGFALNQVLTVGLKHIVDKPRPDMSNNSSFPSRHSSTTFQSASFIQKRYGWSYGIPAYILAGVTAYSRVDAEKHDEWDVIAGAIIGIGSTYLFTTPYQKEHFELTYNKIDNNYLLGFKIKF